MMALMGSGAVANILEMLSGGGGGALHVASVALLGAVCLGFPVVLGLLLVRLLVDREMVIKELEHSSLVQFYSGIFIAAAVCATGLIKIPQEVIAAETTLALAKLYWGLALIFGIGLVLFTPWRIITMNHAEIRRILGFWFLPPVGLFVLVFAGNFIALRDGSELWINHMAVLNSVLMGVALFLGLMMFTMFLLRSLALPFPATMDVIPSFMIGVAPVGVSIIALLSYVALIGKAPVMTFVPVATVAPLIKLLALLLWGFGMWWLLVACMITLTAFLRQGVPVTLGYWAFIFPPAIYTVATLTLGQVTGLGFVQAAGQVLAVVMTVGWLLVFFLTMRGIANGSIFKLPPSFAEILSESKPVAGSPGGAKAGGQTA